MMNPAVRFKAPEELQHEPGMTKQQKVDILERWEHDELNLAAAVNEGMCGEEPLLLARIADALGVLLDSPELDHAPSAKSHSTIL